MLSPKTVFSVVSLSILIKATVNHTISPDSLRLGGTKGSVSVYWQIAHSLQQILDTAIVSITVYAKRFEGSKRRLCHHIQIW